MSEKVVLWGGRFQRAPAEALAALSASVHFNWRLADYDLQGFLAHAKALHEAKLLVDNEYPALAAASKHLRQDVVSGVFTYFPEDEDVHTASGRGLLEDKYAGEELGGKLWAGRPRNDQTATLIRMYLHDAVSHLGKQLVNLVHALINQVEAVENHLMPERTHMQHAQPVLIAHQLMVRCWLQIHNLERLTDWCKRNDASPYGGGTLTGSTLRLDPGLVARGLGLANVCQNSIDGTASRDGVAKFPYIPTQVAVDMSCLAEETIIRNTAEFDYAISDNAYSTGSSIMPQKRNPDAVELVHGKAERLIGDSTGLLAMLKGLPLAHDRDPQEDKEPVSDVTDTLEALLPATTGMVETMRLYYDRMEALSTAGFSLATNVAEWLVKQGVPFRRAHEVSRACVALAESRGCGLEDLNDADSAGVNPALTSEVRDALSTPSAASARRGAGGTASVRVAEQISAARVRLEWLGA